MVSRSTDPIEDFVPQDASDDPSDRRLLRRTQTGRDASNEASPLPEESSLFDCALRDALTSDSLSAARKLVADAEAVLAAHGGYLAGETSATPPSRADLASAKARIAVAVGDIGAAHAILVNAIEAHPDVAALRILMAEVMLATGRATDIRPVLHHLGRDPVASHDQAHLEPHASDRKGR